MRSVLITLAVVLSLCLPCPVLSTQAQTATGSIPDPLRFYNKYETVWEVARRTLVESFKFDIETEDRSGGKIRTRFLEFSSGGLTATDLVKFGNAPQLTDASWVKARYSVDVMLERLNGKEILLTVSANVEGQQRDFQSNETWIPCPSNGTLERRIYAKAGTALLGNDFALPDKKSFWEKGPQPVPSPKIQPTPLPQPDRRPPR